MRDPPLFVCQFYFSFLGKIVRVKFIDDVKAVKKMENRLYLLIKWQNFRKLVVAFKQKLY
jgi:hypothetical protein